MSKKKLEKIRKYVCCEKRNQNKKHSKPYGMIQSLSNKRLFKEEAFDHGRKWRKVQKSDEMKQIGTFHLEEFDWNIIYRKGSSNHKNKCKCYKGAILSGHVLINWTHTSFSAGYFVDALRCIKAFSWSKHGRLQSFFAYCIFSVLVILYIHKKVATRSSSFHKKYSLN